MLLNVKNFYIVKRTNYINEQLWTVVIISFKTVLGLKWDIVVEIVIGIKGFRSSSIKVAS